MCVIAVVEEGQERPTEREVGAMYEQNSFGAGVAWREDGRVRWKKGLKLGDMLELNDQLPFPYVLHFRIPSCGGHDMGLCHPFPILPVAPLDLEGSTEGSVLFHNGHWSRYDAEIRDACYKSRIKLPIGPWSDTRVMAFLASNFGLGILDFIDEKILIFSPTEIKVLGDYGQTGWSYYLGKYLVSNKHWTYKAEQKDWLRQVVDDSINELDRQKIIDTTKLPNDEEDWPEATGHHGTALKPILPKDQTPSSRQVAGDTAEDELSFRRDRGTVQGETDQQTEIQALKTITFPAEGSGVEKGQSTGGRRRTPARNTYEDGGDGSVTGGTSALTITLQEQWKWARSLNPKADMRVVLSSEEAERERRALAGTKGIEFIGRL